MLVNAYWTSKYPRGAAQIPSPLSERAIHVYEFHATSSFSKIFDWLYIMAKLNLQE